MDSLRDDQGSEGELVKSPNRLVIRDDVVGHVPVMMLDSLTGELSVRRYEEMTFIVEQFVELE